MSPEPPVPLPLPASIVRLAPRPLVPEKLGAFRLPPLTVPVPLPEPTSTFAAVTLLAKDRAEKLGLAV